MSRWHEKAEESWPATRGSVGVRGVRQVVEFNWPKVLGGSVLTMIGLASWRRLPLVARLVVGGAAFWTPVSLLASWWVYDRSPLTEWRFFDRLLEGRSPRRILLITAGFDEVSQSLAQVYPTAEITVIDIVADPEASVRRAKRLYPSRAPIVQPEALGEDGSADLVLLAQSAHEVRDPIKRNAMFASARAVLSDGGRVVMVEHLRDLPNVVAFGPGAWHFQPERTWEIAFATAGLRVTAETTVTPLIHCWVLRAL